MNKKKERNNNLNESPLKNINITKYKGQQTL